MTKRRSSGVGIWLVTGTLMLVFSPAQAGFFEGMFAFDTGDYERAYEEWRAEANKGDPKSLQGLGQLYEGGLGVEKDPVLAYAYYDVAYFLGYDPAGQSRDQVGSGMSQADRAEAKRLVAEVKQTGKLPPRSRSAAAAQPSTQAQTAQPTQAPQPAVVPSTKQPSQTVAAAEPPKPATTGGPFKALLDLEYACKLQLRWRDQGSGGQSDVAIYDPAAPQGYFSIGSHPQANYLDPQGCVAVLKPLAEGLIAGPSGWAPVWRDEGSGAQMDGSIWRATPPSADFVCLGMVAQKGYEPPLGSNYGCVHKCAVTEVAAPAPLWTDAGTGARSQVSLYVLPLTNALQAVPGRSRPATLQELNPLAPCLYGQ